ncbi:MAG: glutamate--tRNA ligase [Pseudomonadales bacterium]|jgi:glutamyl-tRNA synthetase|nr:glutamate--tRNA ligase [Pseudomonadales bacterium]
MTVRTRVAPSPTGDPHVGTAYVALFNLAFARSQGGQFVLRIEDTDRARSTARSEALILESLRWLGLAWDEGPEVGGPLGPYRQSERGDLYREHAQRLLDDGHAFHCFCTPERLDEVRRAQQLAKETPRYDGHCLGLDAAEVARRLASGAPSVVRMKVPDEGVCRVEDLFRGTIEIDWRQVDMQVLLKSDAMPTYHLANVVDDHLMEITHVIRGEEWINSAPKHRLLYEYFGWEAPVLAHLPLLRNPDRSKLSKRRNPTSINYYRRMGYLPEALLNFLGLMGHSMPDGREQFGLGEFIEAFSLERVTLGAPVFDQEKLAWLNGTWLRGLDDEAFADRVVHWALNRDHLLPIVPLVRERTERLSDLVSLAGYLVGDTRELSPAAFEALPMDAEARLEVLQFALWQLEAVEVWERQALVDALESLARAMELKIRALLGPLFVALSGRPVALPLYDSMVVLGPDVTRVRIRDAMDVLGGVSKKQAKRFEKRYQALTAGGAVGQDDDR